MTSWTWPVALAILLILVLQFCIMQIIKLLKRFNVDKGELLNIVFMLFFIALAVNDFMKKSWLGFAFMLLVIVIQVSAFIQNRKFKGLIKRKYSRSEMADIMRQVGKYEEKAQGKKKC